MPTRRHPLKVFLCHASEDKPAVRDLYYRLSADGADAWLDEEKLLPGQSWRDEIPRVVHNSDVVIVFLSNQSITKEGYVQKEIRYALDVANEKPGGAIFLIPARLEDCEVPDELKKWQWVDLFSEDGYQKLMMSLRQRAKHIDALPVSITRPTKPKVPKGMSESSAVNEKSIESDSQGRILEEKREKKGKKEGRRFSVELWVAILGAIATIIAALIGIFGPAFIDRFKNTPIPATATPFCLSPDDVLVKVHVLRSNNTEITTLTPGATYYIEPGLTVYFQVELASVNATDLPQPDCNWTNTGSSTDGKLLHAAGCRIDYQGGLNNITDSISLQLSQPSCLALPPYPFFIRPQQ